MKNFAEFMSKQRNAWLLIEKKSRDAVGYVTVDIPYEILKIGEVGYVIGEKYQGNAYAAEALRFLLHMYFTERDLYLDIMRAILLQVRYWTDWVLGKKPYCEGEEWTVSPWREMTWWYAA